MQGNFVIKQFISTPVITNVDKSVIISTVSAFGYPFHVHSTQEQAFTVGMKWQHTRKQTCPCLITYKV